MLRTIDALRIREREILDEISQFNILLQSIEPIDEEAITNISQIERVIFEKEEQ